MITISSILLIESNPYKADIYQIHLERACYNVLIASDIDSADQLIKAIAVELIVISCDKTDQRCLEWIARLRTECRYAKLPVVIIHRANRPFDHPLDNYTLCLEKPRYDAQIIGVIHEALNTLQPSC